MNRLDQIITLLNRIVVALEPKKRAAKPKKDKVVKRKYMDFVMLTDVEHGKLLKKFGEVQTAKWIDKMNYGVGAKGYKYLSHYLAILNWAGNVTEKEDKKVCVVDRKAGFNYQYDANEQKVWLCYSCLEYFRAIQPTRGWGKMPINQIEKVVQEGKAKLKWDL